MKIAEYTKGQRGTELFSEDIKTEDALFAAMEHIAHTIERMGSLLGRLNQHIIDVELCELTVEERIKEASRLFWRLC